MKGKLIIVASILCLLLVAGVVIHAADDLARSEEEDTTSTSASGPVYVDVSSMSADAATFSTTLPIIVINTGGQEITEDANVRAKFDVIDGTDYDESSAEGSSATDAVTNTLSDATALDCYADVKVRGHSSAALSKKSYRISLFKTADDTKEYDHTLMGMAAESDWVLYGPYQDLTLMRNVLMYDLAGQIMEWAPSARYCELWLDGTYQGVYVMVEKIKVSENRLNLKTYSLLTGESSFLIAREIPGSSELEFSSYVNSLGLLYQTFSVEYPKSDTILDSQEQWIEDYIDQFERTLYSDYYLDPTTGYKTYIDMDSFVDYFILNEFSENEDVGYHSTDCYRDVNGKLKMGPVWDFNSGFNNYVAGEYSSDGFFLTTNTWFDRLCTDPDFVDAVVKRWRELREGVLSETNILSMLQSYRDELGAAIDRNDTIWAHYGVDTGLSGSDRDYANYDEAYNQLVDCIVERGRWLDENIDDLYLLCSYGRKVQP